MSEFLLCGRATPRRAATDELLRGCIVHRELGTLTGELSAEDTRALLFMARWMRKRADRASQMSPETNGKE